MLRVGLTGGIGSGKSTVAQRFRELGAVVVDADQLAREVVAVDSAGLAAIRERFGDAVMSPDGSLDRGALGRVVFSDEQARKDLEAITHPLIGARTRALVGAAGPGKIVVHEVPLLAELDMAAGYHLTVVVLADNDIRMARLTGARGFTEADARARIDAQSSDRARLAAADAWLDNNGTVDDLLKQVDALWQDRMVVFNDNLMTGSASRGSDSLVLVAYDDSWPLAAARLSSRIRLVLGERAVAVEHIGSTSVPGLIAEDVIDLQVGVHVPADADDPGFVRALSDKGFPRSEEHLHGSADPGRMVRLHVRQIDGQAWRTALVFRDWLRARADEREAYGEVARQVAGAATTASECVEALRPWLDRAFVRADAWAGQTGWSSR
jgi:dephospho-CoA kinase